MSAMKSTSSGADVDALADAGSDAGAGVDDGRFVLDSNTKGVKNEHSIPHLWPLDWGFLLFDQINQKNPKP